MAAYISAILMGIHAFPVLAVLFTLPMVIVMVIRHKSFNVVRIGLNYAMLLYMVCLFAVVFLPLPTAEQAAALSGYRIQPVPFRFVADIIRESPFRIGNPATYLPAIYNRAVLQVVLNVLMMVPFGMFLRYYCGMSAKKILVLSCMLSLFIEITQLTGIYGVYGGSYRLCDMDDLMANTFGGYLGYRFIAHVENFIPRLAAFDFQPAHKGHASHVR